MIRARHRHSSYKGGDCTALVAKPTYGALDSFDRRNQHVEVSKGWRSGYTSTSVLTVKFTHTFSTLGKLLLQLFNTQGIGYISTLSSTRKQYDLSSRAWLQHSRQPAAVCALTNIKLFTTTSHTQSFWNIEMHLWITLCVEIFFFTVQGSMHSNRISTLTVKGYGDWGLEFLSRREN